MVPWPAGRPDFQKEKGHLVPSARSPHTQATFLFLRICPVGWPGPMCRAPEMFRVPHNVFSFLCLYGLGILLIVALIFPLWYDSLSANTVPKHQHDALKAKVRMLQLAVNNAHRAALKRKIGII